MMTGTYAHNAEAARSAAQIRADRLAEKRAKIAARLETLQAREDLVWDRVGNDD